MSDLVRTEARGLLALASGAKTSADPIDPAIFSVRIDGKFVDAVIDQVLGELEAQLEHAPRNAKRRRIESEGIQACILRVMGRALKRNR